MSTQESFTNQHDALKSVEHSDGKGQILFPGVVSLEESQKIFDTVCSVMEKDLQAYSDDVLRIAEKRYQERQGPNVSEEEKDLYFKYELLRTGDFTPEEIRTLVEAVRSGNLAQILKERVQRELEWVSGRVECSRERIQNADAAVHGYFEDMCLPYPRQTDVPAAFVGKYQNLILGIIYNKKAVPFSARGWAPVGADAIVVRIGESELEEKDAPLSDNDIYAYVHERLHTLSNPYAQKPETYIPFDESSLRKDRSGFSRIYKLEDGRLFSSINEAVTDLFASEICIRIRNKDYLLGYTEEVKSLRELLDFLRDGTSNTPSDQLQELLKMYTSAGGLLALKRILEDRIGPQALQVSEMLFIKPMLFERFLSLVKKKRAGALTDTDTLEIADWQLNQEVAINHSQLLRDYSFVRVYSDVFDTEMRQWKRIYVQNRETTS